jgi:hypothetical protein
MSRGSPTDPNAGPNAAAPCDGSAQTCPLACAKQNFSPVEVNENITETISNAPAGSEAWNGTYGWSSKFTVTADRPGCTVKVTVKIKVTGTITDDQKAAWKSAVETKWNGKVKLLCPDSRCPAACAAGYPVSIELKYVDSGEHYEVTANAADADADGRAGLGGTTSMTGWGVADTIDITHEFGHMLGNPEHYFTTNGTDYSNGGTKQGFRDADGDIMNNPANDPTAVDYTLVSTKAAAAIGGGTSCTAQ